ncbi:class II fructose-1,6-bisphosphate aldolase [Desulfocurvibacter africanus]|uniref:fructose-bisphosphate aldolase n=1 Tax=Desulfocurvibacter africanus PCS TaxID=1262666 RepID=M5PZ93_DESAF|nr:class II fructose-1,6-bisphosphate aldolase [Desulfocurvibacter africanus]EMG35661.1 fructose-bisphosphate aldolase [Desulfocurvibacter africanus PCS]
MPLVSPAEMFKKAYSGGYAVGAFNVNNMEIIQGIMSAGEEERAPLILQVSAGARKYAGQDYIIKLMEAAVARTDLPVALHLDHGQDYTICKEVIEAGFTSVMIDGSHLPYEENIKVTKAVVECARDKGVWVEGELGVLAGVEDEVRAEKTIYTDPDQAVEFVQRTGCDSLAIAIGTSHGAYKFKQGSNPTLDFERLEKIGKLLPGYPIVLHGASSVPQEFVDMANKYGGKIGSAVGVPEELLRKAASMAVCKINIDTDIRLAMTAIIRKHFAEKPEDFDPRSYLKPAREAVKQMVQRKMRNVLGCSGKA